MSGKATPATDAEVVLIEQGNEVCTPCDEGCQYWWTCDGPSIQRLIARIEQDGDRMRELEGLLRNLVSKVEAITNSESYMAVFTSAKAHGVEYDGPNWFDECWAARAVLKEAPDA